MSLLNQVLQDLDERAPSAGPQPVHLSVAPAADQHAADQIDKGPDWARLGSGVAVVVVFVAAVWFFYQSDPSPLERTIGAQPAQVPGSAVIDLVPAAVPGSEAVAIGTPDLNAGSSETAAEQPPVVTGSAGASASNEETEHLAVHPESAAIATVSAGPAAPAPAVPAAAEVRPTAVGTSGKAAPEITYLALKNTQIDDLEVPASKQPAPVKSAARVSVKTLKSSAPQLVEQARKAIAQGELSLAEEQLQRALQLAPADRGARELLVGLMLRGERYEAAMQQLDQGLKQHPGHIKFALIKARMLAQQGDPSAAIDILEKLAASGAGQAERLQMLGALYQQQSRFGRAVNTYRSLLDLNPSVGSSWVGLAISLDGMGNHTALQAYSRALKLGGLPAAAEAYARQRVSQLESGVD